MIESNSPQNANPPEQPEKSGGEFGEATVVQKSPRETDDQLFFLEFCQNEPPGQATLSAFARLTGISPKEAREIADWLWHLGMIQKSPYSIGEAAFQPTSYALEVLARPNGPEDWIASRIIHPDKPASVIRAALYGKVPSPLSNLLLLINIVVFAYGAFLCSGTWDNFWHYLSMNDGDPQVKKTLQTLGVVNGAGWEAGKWWLPLQGAFVHIGVLHILFNGSALWSIGRHIEKVFGSVPFLVIFLASAWLGGCAALAWYPFGSAGASTAISGFIAADTVWFLFCRKQLPRKLRYLWQTQVMVNLGLLATISFAARVSTSGHAGGAIGGALISALWLASAKWGLWRWPATLALLAVCGLAGATIVEVARNVGKDWHTNRLLQIDNQLTKRLTTTENEIVVPLVNTHPALRDKDKVEKAINELNELIGIAKSLEETSYRPIPWEATIAGWFGFDLSVEQKVLMDVLTATSALMEEERDFLDSRLRLTREPYERIQKCRNDLKEATKRASLAEIRESPVEKVPADS